MPRLREDAPVGKKKKMQPLMVAATYAVTK
jgi:hypothetical protein